jgi:hypothetical protein
MMVVSGVKKDSSQFSAASRRNPPTTEALILHIMREIVDT